MRICLLSLLSLLSFPAYLSAGASPAIDTSQLRIETYPPLVASSLGSVSKHSTTQDGYLSLWADNASRQDTVDTRALEQSIERSLWKPSSGRAMLWALLPGGGQIYIMSEDPSKNTAWLVFAPTGAKAENYAQYSSLKQTLKRGNDFYRRYRDLSIVVSVLVYGLSILDAYVDAELYTFDISPDLSLRVVPEVGLPKLGAPSYQLGVNCSLTF